MIKIPVFDTVNEIYKETYGDMQRYMFLAWLWLLIIGATSFFTYDGMMFFFQNPDAIDNSGTGILVLTTMGLLIISALASVFIMTNFLRSSMENRTVLSVGAKDFLFLLLSIVLLLAVFVVFAILAFLMAAILGVVAGTILAFTSLDEGTRAIIFIAVGFFGAIIAGLMAFFIWIRLSLVLPDLYAEKSIGFEKCWQKTKGNFWRLFAISILAGLPFIVPNILMPEVKYIEETNSYVGLDAWAYSNAYAFTFVSVLWAFFLPLAGTMMAKIYKGLVTTDEDAVAHTVPVVAPSPTITEQNTKEENHE